MAIASGACATSGDHRSQGERRAEAARINVQLGVAYLEQGNRAPANAKLEGVLKQDRRLATGHWTDALLQLLQMHLGRPEIAEIHVRESVVLNPEDARGQNNYDTFLCKAGRLLNAQAQFDLSLANPLYDQPETALINAVCALKATDEAQSEDYFRQALGQNPRIVPAFYEMAKLKYDQAQYKQSRAYLQRNEAVAGYSATILWLATRNARRLGDSGAVEGYRLRLNQQYPESREAARLEHPRPMDPDRAHRA
jgi:type IV pilus assembly protein PilF